MHFRKLFSAMASPSEPPPRASPMTWGDPDRITALLGAHFDPRFEHAASTNYHSDGFKTEHGLNWSREYLLTVGTRK